MSVRFAWLFIIGGLVSCSSVSEQMPTPPVTSVSPMPRITPTAPVEYMVVHPAQLRNTYLANPGIGWQTDSENAGSITLPVTVAYAVRRTIAWDILNPVQGEYDWSALDAALQQAVSEGRQLSFRIYSMVGEGLGGQKIPDWVRAEGAAMLSSGEPDYSNCIYQQRWGDFVDALVQRYDGNPNIAFIDISGYGDFNEWSWQNQTRWDEPWQDALSAGTPNAAAFGSLDGQARRRLADIFIGGSFQQHACRDDQGQIQLVDYSYAGFRRTQLVMPFAGIRQSTEYVRWRRADVGFRYDCLGRSRDDQMVVQAAADIWRTAPVVFELCSPDQLDMASVQAVLQQTHGSLVHDNAYNLDPQPLEQLLLNVGYRYALTSASVARTAQAGGELRLSMIWQNMGLAPSYPKMGEDFNLHVYLVDASGHAVVDETLPQNIASWMPAASSDAAVPDNNVQWALQVPQATQPGTYDVQVAIMDQRTGQLLQLAFDAANDQGHYLVGQVTVTR